MANKCFVFHEEVIDVFHNKFYIPTREKLSFFYLMLVLLVQWNVGGLEMIIFNKNH